MPHIAVLWFVTVIAGEGTRLRPRRSDGFLASPGYAIPRPRQKSVLHRMNHQLTFESVLITCARSTAAAGPSNDPRPPIAETTCCQRRCQVRPTPRTGSGEDEQAETTVNDE